MKFKCYFCHIWLHDSHKVRMYDGTIVPSCLKCRELVADGVVDSNDQIIFEELEEVDSA